ncbi:putative polyprenol reductase [Nakaseomyces bracarensis]|uniref:putative polyprenol reductase n=1 Tax=Nakaseomyces bracarensis TaxID=273131 RepID=UPI003871B9A2
MVFKVLDILLVGIQVTHIVGLLSLFIAKYYLPEFLKYGKTFTGYTKGKKSLWNRVKEFSVPKSYFGHFYILSSVLATSTVLSYPKATLAWQVLLHSLRRLYETYCINVYTKDSRMNWSHYAVGIWFYTQLNILVLLRLKKGDPGNNHLFMMLIMILASWDQFKSHKILAKLVKYSLPEGRLFNTVCCPHYFDEIVIYASYITYGYEFFWPLLWVIASLSISAIETRRYYRQKFNDQSVPKYAIIPYCL